MLLKEIDQIKFIDSHEHIPHEKDFDKEQCDFFTLLFPYICDNLVSSGMAESECQKLANFNLSLKERFEILYPYIKNIQFTTYFLSLKKTMQICFLETELSLQSVINISEKMKEKKSVQEIFSQFNIEKAMTFVGYNNIDYFNDSKIFTAVPTVSLITPTNKKDIEFLQQVTNITINSLLDLENAIIILFDSYEKNGIKNIKIGSAYNRKLNFEKSNPNMAKKQLEKVINNELVLNTFGDYNKNLDYSRVLDLDNFVLEKCLENANKYNMTVIIHTGIHAWGSNSIESTNAKYLEKLIRNNSKINFVLLHVGYPFIDEAILLCKYYKNVSLDLAWLHILDREKTVLAIKQIIELLPLNKIVGFGGDYSTPFNTIGHLQIAKENLNRAFSDLIRNNHITKEDAINIIKMWCYENPKRMYRL